MWYVKNDWLRSQDPTKECRYIRTASKFTKSLIWLLTRHGLVSYYWRRDPAEMVVILDGFIVKRGMSEDMYNILAVMLEDYMVGE